jgi:hypothetical protein
MLRGTSARAPAAWSAAVFCRFGDARRKRQRTAALQGAIARSGAGLPMWVAERPKLSDPAHGTQRLQPRRPRRVSSAWLGDAVIGILR